MFHDQYQCSISGYIFFSEACFHLLFEWYFVNDIVLQRGFEDEYGICARVL